MGKNYVTYGDAETLMSGLADKIEHLTYVGTKAAWESMSVAERQKYRAFDFTDYDADTDTENRLTALESGIEDLQKVTSGTGTLLNGATGNVNWYKYGRICIVRVHNLVFNTTEVNRQIIKGLPTALFDIYSTVSANLNNGTGNHGQLHILRNSDTIDTGWGATSSVAEFTGELVYITAN